MKLSYVQLDEDFLERDALVVAASACLKQASVIGYGAMLFKFAVEYTSTDKRPPDGVIAHPDAGRILERAMGWTGKPGKLIDAFILAKVVEKLEIGMRVRGMRRYLAMWKKSYPDAAKALRDSSVTVTEPERERDGTSPEPTRKKEKEKEKENKKESTASFRSSSTAPPVRETITRVERPTLSEPDWVGQDFWRWFQFKRQEAGLVSEDPPDIQTLEHWYHVAKECVAGDVRRLKSSVIAFGESKFWQDKEPPLPFDGFKSVFKKFIPQEKPHAHG